MKRYLVKCTGIAKDTNPNFANMESVFYYGKREKTIAHLGNYAKELHSEMPLKSYMIGEYGYTRKCDAHRSSILKLPKETKYWNYDYEVVECEI